MASCTLGRSTADGPALRELQVKIDRLQTEVARLEADSTRGKRYEVVNGTPTFAANIMLLDRQTGRTWRICELNRASLVSQANWCAMQQFENSTRP